MPSLNPNWFRKVKDRLNPRGHEILDPTPIAPPVGYQAAPSLREQIRDMVRSERLAQEVAAAGFETFEEADDFDVGDDFDPRTPYEERFDPDGRSNFEPITEVNRQEDAANKKAAASKASPAPQPSSEAKPQTPADPPQADQPKEPPKGGR